MSAIIPGAEPFFVRGGPVGLLLIHGFTASPSEMRPLAEALKGEGYTLLGLRLPQHGTTPEDMRRSQRRDWLAAALDGYCLLRDQCDKIFVAGLSMGGALAFLLASQQPVAGVISISTPGEPFHAARGWRQRNAGWLGHFFPYMQKGPHLPPDAAHPVPRISYRVRPVLAIAQFYAVIHAAALALPQIQAPTLIFHSKSDGLIPVESAEHIHAHLGSVIKELVLFERGDHVLTEDPVRYELFRRAQVFLKTHA